MRDPQFIKKAAELFGSQSIVISIDVKKTPNSSYKVYADSGTKNTGLDPEKWARTVETLGTGEILLTSIGRDGTMEGYDTDLIHRVSEVVDIPLIVCGGAGRVEDTSSP